MADTDKLADQKVAGVIVRPPLLFLGALIAALILDFIWPFGIFSPNGFSLLPGVILLIGGGMLLGSCLALFAQAETPVQTSRPTQALVTSGPFRYSRNPIYISLFMIYLGLNFLFNSWWGIMLLPFLFIVMEYGVVRREEAYLAAKFGVAYKDYQSRVRRWF